MPATPPARPLTHLKSAKAASHLQTWIISVAHMLVCEASSYVGCRQRQLRAGRCFRAGQFGGRSSVRALVHPNGIGFLCGQRIFFLAQPAGFFAQRYLHARCKG